MTITTEHLLQEEAHRGVGEGPGNRYIMVPSDEGWTEV